MAGRGRPRGSNYWTPEQIADFWWHAQIAAETLEAEGTRPNKRLVAKRLKQQFGYRQTEEQLRQLLSKAFERWRNTEVEIDEFNARMWARMLGETENEK
jgi:hypothetical protein